MVRPILCAVSIIFLRLLTKLPLDTVVSAFLLSFGIGYVLYYAAVAFVTLMFMPFTSSGHVPGTIVDRDEVIYLFIYALTSILQLFLSYLLFRIRRFRSGFSFLLKRYSVVLALIFAGLVLVLVTWIKFVTAAADTSTMPLLFSGVLIMGAGVYIWIRRGISSLQWRKTMLRNNELLEQALTAEKETNRQLREKLETAQVATHKMLRRFEAMEYKVARMAGNMEFSGELGVSIEEIQRLQREYQEDVVRKREPPRLPLTKIKEIDILFESFAVKFTDNNIDFKLKVTGSILYMVEHVIPQSKLETMIGDHLQDALIAVNASDGAFRSVLAVLGVTDGCYALTVFDSGIPFEPDTLIRLGTVRVTTHADIGGSGIGFMTTFETMRGCGASLVINEKKPSGADFTKSVTIRFDGKNEYRVETYRPEVFPVNDRYVVIG